MKHKIWLAALPPTRGWPTEVKAAWYGPVRGVSMNFPLYCRVDDEKDAYEYDRCTTVRIIQDFHRSGYPCCAVPPIEVTY